MRKLLLAIICVLFLAGSAMAGGDDWRYRNHPDRFKPPEIADYDGDGVPNFRDWRDDIYHRPGPGYDEEDEDSDVETGMSRGK